ncbi:DUF1127 domain-containing protein [Roseovarius aestuarii]|nr:DUF1127 domain-containing protein [Roseovarius aestuarii]
MLTRTTPDRMDFAHTTARPAVTGGVVTLKRMTLLMSQWSHRIRSRRTLSRMDSAALNDIGLTAREAAHEARKWFWMP